ncbi:MAG: heparinase II/III-family protein [Bacteroidales bacterium]|nr:heparinase II/III-family protein [Bacteroidales bacterium]
MNTHSCSYRDFRPSLQLSAVLFFKATWFKNDKYNESLFWFGLNQPLEKKPPEKQNFSAHGYATLHGENTWALIKWPFYQFRPSHNDALHVDIWHNGKNIICDAGSYSYNPGNEFEHDLKSVHFHNTVSFDGHEQMPKLSRFLMANWLKAETALLKDKENADAVKWEGSYTDTFGNNHHREVELYNNQWIITDKFSGNFIKVVIGFNINSNECYSKSNLINTPAFKIHAPKKAKAELKEIWASQYYQEKHIIKRLEMTVYKPGTYETIITLV